MNDSSPSKFLARLEEKKAALAAAKEAESKEDSPDYSGLVPVLPDEYKPSDTDIQIAELLDGLSVLDAYNMWCRKSTPKPGSRTEGIKVSCPIPSHPDKDPSAWLNTKKNIWFCGGCDIGGDSYDIAAYHFNYPVPGYKDGKFFGQLRAEMAAALGYRVLSAPGVEVGYFESTEEEASTPAPVAEVKEKAPATVTNIDGTEEEEYSPLVLSSLDWEPLIEPGTFLDRWMQATKIDDIPDEYYLWSGMLAIGLAMGRGTSLYDRRPVFGNLYICIVGETGSGKSQSEGQLVSLLSLAMPFDHEDPFNTGVDLISAPASGEALVWSFQKDIIDPSTSKVLGQMPVKGLLRFNELSALTSRSGRAGSSMKPTLMELYDCSEIVGTRSRMHGKTIAKQPFASLITTTQPRSMGKLLTGDDVEAGFINRFIFVSGKVKKRVAIGGAKIDISDSVRPIQEIKAWSATTPQVQWSDKADRMFDDYFHAVLEPAKRRGATLARLDLLAKKLVLLFTANEKEKEVPISAVERTIAMMPYLIACYGFTEDQIGSDTNWEIRKDILRHVERHAPKGGITLRDLNKLVAKKKYPTATVRRTLDDLVHLQIIVAAPTKGRGRPTVKYNVVEE